MKNDDFKIPTFYMANITYIITKSFVLYHKSISIEPEAVLNNLL